MPLVPFTVSDNTVWSPLLMSLTRALSFLSIFLRLPMRMKSFWSLPSIVSSLRVAVVAARCSNVSVSSLVIAAVVAACFCSSISATSFAASFSLVTYCCSSISDSSCAAACCSPFTLISSSSYLCSTSWSFVDKLETSRGSNEAKYLVYLVSLWDFVSAFSFPILLFSSTWEEEMCGHRSVVDSPVNHAVCLRVSAVSCFPVSYHAVQMFLFSIQGCAGALFSVVFLKVVMSAT